MCILLFFFFVHGDLVLQYLFAFFHNIRYCFTKVMCLIPSIFIAMLLLSRQRIDGHFNFATELCGTPDVNGIFNKKKYIVRMSSC